MENPKEAHTFSQVVFIDTPYSYRPAASLTCRYTLTAGFQPSPRDWVGIFKVGWSTTKDYHTFVWVEPCLDVVSPESATRQAVFKDYYLPKDELDFYQFCYVDSGGQVRGASTPFCFKNPAEQSPESLADEDLLVITTQEQVELSLREKAELQKELDQTRGEKETLKNDLQMEQQQAASLKAQNEQKEKEVSQLLKEMDQIKEQNEDLRSALQQKVKETDGFKEEMMKQTEKQLRDATEEDKQSWSVDAASTQNEVQTHAQEKYERAVMKIKQLKAEREELRGRVDAQRAEINELNSKIGEQGRELLKMTDDLQLLQVDLQSVKKEKERFSVELQRSQSLVHDMDAVKRENQELHTSLFQQMTLQNCPDDDLRAECQTLAGQLQDAQRKLAAEREETKNIRRRAEYLDNEQLQVKEQLEKMAVRCEQAERIKGKQELQLTEAHETIAEARIAIAERDHTIEKTEQIVLLETKEKEELAKVIQTLTSDIERLRSAYDDLRASPPAVSPAATSPAANASANDSWQQQPESPEEPNPYQNVGIPADTEEELALVCRHCQESFPCITRNELEAHEQSHRVCPFCTIICDNMEQSVFEDHVYSHEV